MRKNANKLQLNRETIKALSGSDLELVAGGATLNCEKTQLNCPTAVTCAANGCLG